MILASQKADHLHDRDRICASLVELVAERGYAETTIEALLQRAAVDAETFERHFTDLEACFTFVWERFSRQFLECTGGAYAAAGSWREGMRAAAWAFISFIREDHGRARFLIDSTFANAMVEAKRDFIMRSYADLIHLGRLERQRPSMPRDKADAIVGAIWEAIASRISAGAFDELPAGVPQMMYLTMLTYLGPEAAQEELRRGPDDIARFERGEL